MKSALVFGIAILFANFAIANETAGTGAISATVQGTREDLFTPPPGRPQPPPALKNCLSAVEVDYFDNQRAPRKGTIVINKDLVDDIKQVFGEVFEHNKQNPNAQFPITSIVPVSNPRFNWDDDRSMDADNSSGYNFRYKNNGHSSRELSMHALGRAFDLNTRCNPFVGAKSMPPGASYNRSRPCAITRSSVVYKAFVAKGWEWGGNWSGAKDYQHFEKPGRSGTKPPYCSRGSTLL